MIGWFQVISVSTNCLKKEKKHYRLETLKAKFKTPIPYVTARNCKFLKCTFVCTGIGLVYMKNVFKKYLDIHSQGKSDKNGIFDVVTSCSIFDKYISSKNTF